MRHLYALCLFTATCLPSFLLGQTITHTIHDVQGELFSSPLIEQIVTVGGILEQSSYLFSAGVWMSSEPVIEQYDGDLTRVYVSVSPGSTASSSFDDEGVSYYEAAGKSKGEREAAAELSQQLSLDLEKEGIQVSLIAEEVALIQSLVLSILALFEGYLSIGLVIGIAGIGVVTYRSVS